MSPSPGWHSPCPGMCTESANEFVEPVQLVKSQGLLVLGVGFVLATSVLSMCLSSFCPCISLIGRDCICMYLYSNG